jgi:hypothetical protein
MFRRAPFIWTARQPIDPFAYWKQFLGGVERRDDARGWSSAAASASTSSCA